MDKIMYEDYTVRLKQYRPDVDFDGLYERISRKAGRVSFGPMGRFSLALAGAAVVASIAAFAFVSYFSASPGELAMDYVFGNGRSASSPVMAYVFSE